ncbi:hypothetical protein [Streptomyces sp. bgisy154]|uniref:hypothetical protein n=1 Tax=Streptomyces sp. bgisy154 TaxID=3413794 RepID=UPI003D73C040
MTDRPEYGCSIDGQPVMPIRISEYNQLVADLAEAEARADRAEAALTRARSLHRETCPVAQRTVPPTAFTCGMCNTLDSTEPGRDCRFTAAGQRPCPPSEPCATCDPKESGPTAIGHTGLVVEAHTETTPRGQTGAGHDTTKEQ